MPRFAQANNIGSCEPAHEEGLVQLPIAFCWTKFGTEAGESALDILRRKERERLAGGGTFLWGIGSSIAPSLRALLALDRAPEIIFTPMLSSPAAQDIAPPSVTTWRAGLTLDGQAFDIPQHARVTSRAPSPARWRHFALVCERRRPLGASAGGTISTGAVRNLLTGMPVGSSQVTSVVRSIDEARPSGRVYHIAFRARLVHPYLVMLSAADECDPTVERRLAI